MTGSRNGRPTGDAASDLHQLDAPSLDLHQLDAPSLDAERVVVTAGGTVLIDGVDCSVPAGSLAALIGPNGAGKSTLLRALAAIERPAAGSIRLDDVDLTRMTRRDRARSIAFVEQDASTELTLTVREVVELGRTPYQPLFGGASGDDTRLVDHALERTGVAHLAARELVSLSGGERQRVLLAKALAQSPRMLLLDEPTNHLDISAQLDVLALLAELSREGVTVLAALHDLALAAAWTDHLIVLRHGRVAAAGPTAEVLTPRLIRAVYGVDAEVLANPLTGRTLLAFRRARPE